MSELIVVVIASLGTALATGLGALPLIGGRSVSRRALGIAAGVAAGIMLAASFRLINEGVAEGVYRTVAGVLVGSVLIWIAQRFVGSDEKEYFEEIEGTGRKAFLILGVMTLHSFAEGIGVGVSFGGAAGFGLFIALAIAIHNIPEGIAGGAMIWMVIAEILPDAAEDAKPQSVALAATLAAAGMVLLQVTLHV